MNDTEQIQIDRFLATELGEQNALVGIKSSKIMPKFLLTNETDPLDSKKGKFLFYDSGGESSIKVEDGPTSYSYTGYLEMSHMLNVFENLGIGEKKYTQRLTNVTLNQLISTYFKTGVHIYFKAGDLVLVSNDTPIEKELLESDVPNPTTGSIDITNVYNLMGLIGKKGEDGKYKFKKNFTDNTKLRYVIHFTIGEQFIFRNDLISVSESEDTLLKAEEKSKKDGKTTYIITNKDGKVLYFGNKQLDEIGDMDSIYTKSSVERAEFYTNVYKNKSFGNTNINIHNSADYCEENVFTMKNLNEIKSEIDIQLQLQEESAQTETQITYTDNLDQLLQEDDSKPTKMYRPSKKLSEIPNYFREYTTTSGEKVRTELSQKKYTREMRTAMVKRWLQIKKSLTPHDPSFNDPSFNDPSFNEVLFELIPEKGMNTQLMSVLFHLIEMGFEDAIPFYDVINKVIINSPNLLNWLSLEFKNSGDTHSRREYLKFKYLYERLINEGNSEQKLKEKEPQIKSELKLDKEEFKRFMMLMKETRSLVNYNQKKEIVRKNLDFFKKLTGNVNHFKYFLDLDYFFIVFEMLIDKSNAVVKAANKYLIKIFKQRPPTPPPRTSPPPLLPPRPPSPSSSTPPPLPPPRSPSQSPVEKKKGGSIIHSKKRSFNESSKKTKKISYN